jgi:hypothetical protein
LSCPISGCAGANVVTSLPESGIRVVPAGSNLYVATKHHILVVPKDGSAPARSIADVELPGPARDTLDFIPLTLHGDRILWGDVNGNVANCPTSGCPGSPSVIATGQGRIGALAADGENAYWVRASADSAPGSGEIVKCALTGCGTTPTVLVPDQRPSGVGLSVDDAYVYWTNSGEREPVSDGGDYRFVDGNVSRAPK